MRPVEPVRRDRWPTVIGSGLFIALSVAGYDHIAFVQPSPCP